MYIFSAPAVTLLLSTNVRKCPAAVEVLTVLTVDELVALVAFPARAPVNVVELKLPVFGLNVKLAIVHNDSKVPGLPLFESTNVG